jgi:uncharacterized protein YjdB
MTFLPVGFKLKLSVWFSPENVSSKGVIWRVQEITGMASVTQDGLVMAESTGKVNIIAISADGSGKRDTLGLSIMESPILVEEISLKTTTGMTCVPVNGELQFLPEILPINATNKNIIWKVEKGTGDATITQNGFLMGISPGIVRVVAKADDGSGTRCVCEVTIYKWYTDIYENNVMNVVLYPNPSSGTLYLDPGNIVIDLVQVVGYNGLVVGEIIPDPNSSRIQIDISDQPPGPYFVRIVSGNQIIVKNVSIYK